MHVGRLFWPGRCVLRSLSDFPHRLLTGRKDPRPLFQPAALLARPPLSFEPAGAGHGIDPHASPSFWAAALLVAAGISFPISRIARLEWMAHLTDLLLALPFWWLEMARQEHRD